MYSLLTGREVCALWWWEMGEEEHYDYSSYEDPDELREFIGEDLDDEWGISDDG